jgi:hypothetical protein
LSIGWTHFDISESSDAVQDRSHAGVLAPTSEVEKFLADPDPKKRERKVDELLGRKEFTDLWALKWSELLQIRSDQNNGGYSPDSASAGRRASAAHSVRTFPLSLLLLSSAGPLPGFFLARFRWPRLGLLRYSPARSLSLLWESL